MFLLVAFLGERLYVALFQQMKGLFRFAVFYFSFSLSSILIFSFSFQVEVYINIAMSLSYSALSTHQGLPQQRLNSRVLQTKMESTVTVHMGQHLEEAMTSL